MPKLIYWKADCLTDSDCYSIREKTKKACKAAILERGHNDFSEPHKVEVHYGSAFDLMKQCTGEGGLWEG